MNEVLEADREAVAENPERYAADQAPAPKRKRGRSRKTRKLMEQCRAEGYEAGRGDFAPMQGLALAIISAVCTAVGIGLGAWIF